MFSVNPCPVATEYMELLQAAERLYKTVEPEYKKTYTELVEIRLDNLQWHYFGHGCQKEQDLPVIS